jgi:drug/metabolite transporter (DMT)-like permease
MTVSAVELPLKSLDIAMYRPWSLSAAADSGHYLPMFRYNEGRMTTYFLGISAAFLTVICHGWANIFDSYFTNKIFKRLPILIFFSELTNLIFLPLVLVIDFPHALSWQEIGIVLCIACIENFYQYPYYAALRAGDTSVVASLFSLGKIFIPLIAFFLVGERLTGIQYFGFFILVFSSIVLTLDLKKLRLNQAFILMLAVSLVLSLQAVLYKLLFTQGVSWGSAVVWTGVVQFLMAGIVMGISGNVRDFAASRAALAKVWPLFLGTQLLSWGGSALSDYAILLIPVSLESGITSTQSIFVLLFAVVFASRFPKMFKEYIGSGGLWKKGIAFLLMIMGTVFITA